MFWEMVSFELKYRLTKLSTYVYMVLFFLISGLAVVISAGAFTGTKVNIAGGEKLLLNSPFFIHTIVMGFQMFAIFICAAFSGNAISRDHECNMFQIIYSKPVSKFSYLVGRFVGNAVVLTFILLSVSAGIFVASQLPWLDKSYFGPTIPLAYIWPYIIIILPNMLFTCGIFFAIGALTKKQISVYISAILLVIFYTILGTLADKVSLKQLIAVLDPSAMFTTSFISDKLTMAEMNTKLLPLAPVLIINRILWLGVGFLLFWTSFIKTSFAYPESGEKQGKQKQASKPYIPFTGDLSKIKKEFSFAQSLRQFYYLCQMEIRNITSRFYFWLLYAIGLVLIGFTIFSVGQIYETNTLPVTYKVLDGLTGGAGTLLLVIVTLFTGELLWKSRTYRMDLIMDSTPAKSWVFMFSKFVALLSIEMFIIITAMLIGIVFQLANGFTNIKPDVYLVILGYQFMSYLRLTAIAFTIHILVNNKYLSHFVFLGFMLLTGLVRFIGLEHPLFHYGNGMERSYSDMSGWNGTFSRSLVYTVLWTALVGIGFVIGYLFYTRGRNNNIKERIALAKQRINPGILRLAGGIGVLYLLSAGVVFYNTNIINTFHLQKTWTKLAAKLEKTYKAWDGIPNPRITDVSLKIDLYPEKQEGIFSGRLILMNKESVPIDSMYVGYNEHLELKQLAFSKAVTTRSVDTENGVRTYYFKEPLMPGESFVTEFMIISKPEGYSGGTVKKNGTFMTNMEFMPGFAYNSQGEISSPDKRKKMGLPPKERMPQVDDIKGRMNTFISNDADWVNYDVVMSTTPAQTAISPGYLIKEWTEGDRRYFHYKMDKPILNFVAFLSAKLEVKKSVWQNKTDPAQQVNLEIYYDKDHPYNLDRMFGGMKDALSYYTENFGHFQHRVLRIVEFPRWASYAQSFPTTIPFSESIGFIAHVREKKGDIDYPYWVTAHETAHQWWAHQVVGGAVQGSQMLSEAFAQYSSLKVMAKKYGESNIGKFLKNELDSYVMMRSSESRSEQPLYKVETQQYIFYNKGSVVMYGMADRIGEKNMNKALSEFLQAYKYSARPYPNTIEFLTYLEKETPDSLKYLIDDWFKKVTLYDNKITHMKYTKPTGKVKTYKVDFDVETAKMFDDGKGVFKNTVMNDPVEVVVLAPGAKGNKDNAAVLYHALVKITNGKQHFTVITTSKPDKVGVDPYFKLVDKNPYDNVVSVTGSIGGEVSAQAR